MHRWLCFGLALLALAMPGRAAAPGPASAPQAPSPAAETALPAPRRIARVVRLSDGLTVERKQPASLQFDLPEVPEGDQVRLSLDARAEGSSWCTRSPAMAVAVNGKSIVGADLLNKPLEYRPRNGRDSFWAMPRGDTWYLFTWPDFSVEKVRTYDSPDTVLEADPFAFVWDITPHVRPGANTVTFTHLDVAGEAQALVLKDVRVVAGEPVASPNAAKPAGAPTGPLPSFVPRGPQRVPMSVEMTSAGAMRVRVGGRLLDLRTRTSEPEGGWRVPMAGDWAKVSPKQPGRAEWAGQGYQVVREVTLRDDHVHVSDTFTHTGTGLVGVLYENALMLPEPPLEVMLGGRPAYAAVQSDAGGANPTAVARWSDLAVGLVAEDDVFRAHAQGLASEESVGLADHELGIAPGAQHTLEWSIYPLPGGDYWSFINAVRRNWGANFAIPGMCLPVEWSGGEREDGFYRQYLQSRGVTMVTSLGAAYDDGKPAMGTAIPLAKAFCERARKWIGQVHAAAPGVKTLFPISSGLCTEPGAPENYADSRLLRSDGTQATMPAGPAGVATAPLFLSTLENSHGKALMDVAKWVVTDLGADGLYYDILSGAGGYQARAYNAPWDGCTVTIDPKTHAVLGKASSVALLQQPWHAALAEYLRANGKVLIGSGPVETRTLLNLKIPVCVETDLSYSSVLDTHLGSPWGLGNHPVPDPGRDTIHNAAYHLRRILDYGGILALSGWPDEPQGETFLHLLYPFTPIELRPGVVVGEERIVTNRSGRFGWPDGSAADVRVFDGSGRPVAGAKVREIRKHRRRLYELRLPGDHFAILLRRR